ncbi:MAG TPA: AAA family ATPase, partial [Acidimicrobiales bacterium]
RMQDTLAAARAEGRMAVEVRIGVNTGEVLVGALRAGGDYTAMGDVVNAAQRLQVAAAPGSVVVGPATYAATREIIAYQSLGAIDAKGRDEPIQAWAALEPLLPPGHRPRRVQTPFVGRDAELGVLSNAVDAAVERRRAHLLLLIGDAGVGKSRLAEEAASVARRDHSAKVFEGRCVPYGEANVWWPIAEALRQACEIGADDPLADAERRAGETVTKALGAGGQPAEVKRIVGGLLFLMGYEVALREIDPQRAREEATRAMLTFVDAASGNHPVVLVLSDLHWADPLVLELLTALMDRLARRPFTLIATARQSILTGGWSVPIGRHNTVLVNLDPLDSGATGELLDALLPGEVPAELRAALLDRSGGNPFFLEELVALLGDPDLSPGGLVDGLGTLSELPDTLRGLVAARLDGLTRAERGTLEDAAVWGQSGPVQALETMAAEMRGAADLAGVLAGLESKEILRVDGHHWSFRSDLIREVAYGILTKADRARRHYGIAYYLSHTVDHRRQADARLVDMVAFHFGAAADLAAELGPVEGVPTIVTSQALDWLGEAARRAEVAQALPVAERLYSQALRLVTHAPSVERINLLLGRAGVEADMRDLAAARVDVEEAHALALELHDEGGVARSLLVRGEIERGNGDLSTAVATLEAAVERFRELGDDRGAADAMREIGMAQIFLGNNDEAEKSIRAGLAASKAVGDRRGEAWALQHLAWISFVQGRSAEAESRLTRSADTFAELGDVGGLGWATGLLAFVRFNQGHLEEAWALGEQVLIEARERGDRWGEGMMNNLGAAVAQWSGRSSSAVEFASEAHAVFQAIGDQFGELQAMVSLGRSLVSAGRVQEGLEMMQGGVAAVMVGDRALEDRFTLAAGLAGAAVAVGAPELALSAIDGVQAVSGDTGGLGGVERVVAHGLALLQVGRAEEAAGMLRATAEGSADVVPSAYAQSALALALAALGEDAEALVLAAEVSTGGRATYLDRVTAEIAAGLIAARRGDDDALTMLSGTIETVDALEDEVAQAIARLAEAAALRALDLPSAPEAGHVADARLAALGINAEGWRRVIDLVLAPKPASV